MFKDYITNFISSKGVEVSDSVVGHINCEITKSYQVDLERLKEKLKSGQGLDPQLEPEEYQAEYAPRSMEIFNSYINQIYERVGAYIDFD